MRIGEKIRFLPRIIGSIETFTETEKTRTFWLCYRGSQAETSNKQLYEQQNSEAQKTGLAWRGSDGYRLKGQGAER